MDDIYELQARCERLEKLLSQAIERQINPPVMLEKIDQDHLDRECNEAMDFAHSQYMKIFFRLYYKRDFGI